jgi:hypothetical protein
VVINVSVDVMEKIIGIRYMDSEDVRNIVIPNNIRQNVDQQYQRKRALMVSGNLNEHVMFILSL